MAVEASAFATSCILTKFANVLLCYMACVLMFIEGLVSLRLSSLRRNMSPSIRTAHSVWC